MTKTMRLKENLIKILSNEISEKIVSSDIQVEFMII